MDAIWPVIALVLGWGLNEISQAFRTRQGYKAELCRAISVLLEIRFLLRTSEEVISLLSERTGISRSEFGAAVRPLVLAKYISADTLSSYEKAIEAIAAHDPFLAYEMRGRNRVGEAFGTLVSFPAQLPPEAKVIEETVTRFAGSLSDFASKEGIPMLESCILDLAKSVSFRTWWRCKLRLNRSEPLIKKDDPGYALVAQGLDEFIRAAIEAEKNNASNATEAPARTAPPETQNA